VLKVVVIVLAGDCAQKQGFINPGVNHRRRNPGAVRYRQESGRDNVNQRPAELHK
jgi:hypothetical protein